MDAQPTRTYPAKKRRSLFFDDLPSFDTFGSISDLDQYTPAPAEWMVIITDIQGSTSAIDDGHYKDVNMVGAASISAVLNVTRKNEIPYAFGGDGATFVAPVETIPRIREALIKTRNLADGQFGLTLRLGAVPVAKIREQGADVLIAKYRLSEGNYLAMFAGGGVSLADNLIKGDDGTQGYLIEDAITDDPPDLEGLSCRWEPLEAQRGQVVSILVHAIDDDYRDSSATYERVLNGIENTFGDDLYKARPIRSENMKFRWPPRGLLAEARATHGNKSLIGHLLFLYWQSFLQNVLEKFDLSGGGYNAPVYRDELRQNSDYRRFDDTLRMVLDCTDEEVAALTKILDGYHAEGLIAYGMHRSDSALMTCLLFSLEDSEHVHFIDGASGGYAMAARQMKEQLAAMA